MEHLWFYVLTSVKTCAKENSPKKALEMRRFSFSSNSHPFLFLRNVENRFICKGHKNRGRLFGARQKFYETFVQLCTYFFRLMSLCLMRLVSNLWWKICSKVTMKLRYQVILVTGFFTEQGKFWKLNRMGYLSCNLCVDFAWKCLVILSFIELPLHYRIIIS